MKLLEGYTPGPWKINSKYTSPHIEGAGGEFIATVVSALGMNEFANANARLLAAAPEMLEALVAGAKYLDALGEFQNAGVGGKMVESALLDQLAEDYHSKTYAILNKLQEKV